MKSMISKGLLLVLLGFSTLLLSAAHADGRGRKAVVRAHLSGYNEVPALSSSASGRFFAIIDEHTQTIAYRLVFSGFETPVLQSHLHIGQRHTGGGISVFICTNLDNGPAGTPECGNSPAVVTGTIVADAVLGPAGQGIAAGEFDELVDAIRAGAVYVNVHSQTYPAGEIRGQLQ